MIEFGIVVSLNMYINKRTNIYTKRTYKMKCSIKQGDMNYTVFKDDNIQIKKKGGTYN